MLPAILLTGPDELPGPRPHKSRELCSALDVSRRLRQRPDGRWGWKMDPAYITQRVARGAPPRPPLWPAFAALPVPTMLVWGTDGDVLSEAQARRMVETLPKGELVAVPGVGRAPTLIEPAVRVALARFLGAL